MSNYDEEKDTRKIAYFTYDNVLSFEKWGIVTNTFKAPKHLVHRLLCAWRYVAPRHCVPKHAWHLVNYFGTPLGEAVAYYDQYLVGDFYPDDHPDAGSSRFKFLRIRPFDYQYIFPNGWGLGVEAPIGGGATLFLVQDGNPEPVLYAPDWWPNEQPKDPDDLFDLVFNAPKAEGVAE